MEYFLIILGVICSILGVIGCVLPALPGPPLSYTSLLLLQFSSQEHVFTKNFLMVLAVITVLVSLGDYFLPLWGAKRYGTSRQGVWGAVIGMVIGIFFFPPLGMIIGLFMGAILGEIVAGKENSRALRSGMIIFLGSVMAIFVKLSLSLVLAFYFFTGLFRLMI